MKKYTYDAFISYRHTELDKFVAENLHKMLEAFRLPGNIAKKKKDGRTRIERVFRDKEELPLTGNLEDPIMQALRQSEYLIVICSPRLRESLWCRKEIETFIELHGREKVLAVLIEGEPSESFPEELLYVNETIQKQDGTTEVVKKPMEPLAADVRGKNKKEMLKAMRTEILRLLAPMFDLGYDDLRQRHRERKMKRVLAASLIGAAVCLGFGAFSTAMALRINSQKEQIEAQNLEIQAKTSEIQLQNSRLMENQAENLAEESLRRLANGDRIGAINTAVSALTEYEGMAMPYTTEAQYALTESLHVYDCGSSIKPQYQLEALGVIDFVKLSPNRKILLTYDASRTVTLWNVAEGTKLAEIADPDGSIYAEYGVTFLGNDRLAYRTQDGMAIYDVEEKKVTNVEYDDFLGVSAIYADKEGKYLIVCFSKKIILYEADTLAEVSVYETEEMMELRNGSFFMDDSGQYFVFAESKMEEDNWSLSSERELRFWNLENDTVSDPIVFGTNIVRQVQYVNGTAYVLANYSGESAFEYKAILIACNPETGKLIWQKEYPDCFGTDLYISNDRLLLESSYEARVISMENGEEIHSFALGNSIVGVKVLDDSKFVLLFTRNGEYYYADVVNGESYVFEGLFQCHSQNVKCFDAAVGGFIVLPYSDNLVTVYNYSDGPGVVEYEGVVSETEEEWGLTTIVDIRAYAGELGSEKSMLASAVFFNADESLAGVYYTDDSFEIYDNDTNTLLCEVESVGFVLERFVGIDAAGNIYVEGYGKGLMFSRDYELLAEIEGLTEIDIESNSLILEKSENYYTVPIYTVEELLAIAQSYVIK